MKQQFLIFCLGISVAISIAATTTNLMTVKPATPVSVIVERIDDTRDMLYSTERIKKYVRDGYILKSQNSVYNTRTILTVIVLEKY